MSEFPEDLAVKTQPPAPWSRLFRYGLVAILATSLAATLAVGVPGRWKLLGLFPLFWGGLCGYGHRRWAEHLQVPVNLRSSLFVALLIFLGEIALVLGGWSLYRNETRRKLGRVPSLTSIAASKNISMSNPRGTGVSEALSSPPANPITLPDDVQDVFKDRQQELLSLSGYLSRRFSSRPNSPWPELFFLGEVLLGTALGVSLFRGWLEPGN